MKGRLGDGTTTDRPLPTRIGTEGAWVAVVAGGHHSLVLRADGSLWGWGSNFCGQLGDGTTTDRFAPTRIGSDTDWVAIAGGVEHSIALRSDNSLWTWGANDYGQLGDGTTIDRRVPTHIGAVIYWDAVSAGSFHSMALLLRDHFALLAWGSNHYGQLGDGSTTWRFSPVSAGEWPVFTRDMAIFAGGAHSLVLRDDTLAITTGASLLACGNNERGQVGNGTTTNCLTLTNVFSGVKFPVAGAITPTTTSPTTTSSSTTTTTSSSTTTTSTTSSSTTTTLPARPAFPDVPADHPYHEAISGLAAWGAISGYEDGTFGPEDLVKRQHFAKMIVKALRLPVTGAEVCPFVDVQEQQGTDPFYPSKHVAVCAAQGITKGKTATTFDPDSRITHQQLISMVARAADLADPPSGYVAPFTPAQFSLEEHYRNACKAEHAGLLDGLQGVGGARDFQAAATQGERAQLLHELTLR